MLESELCECLRDQKSWSPDSRVWEHGKCICHFYPRGISRPESIAMATKLHVKNTGGALELRCSLEKQERLNAKEKCVYVFVCV